MSNKQSVIGTFSNLKVANFFFIYISKSLDYSSCKQPAKLQAVLNIKATIAYFDLYSRLLVGLNPNSSLKNVSINPKAVRTH